MGVELPRFRSGRPARRLSWPTTPPRISSSATRATGKFEEVALEAGVAFNNDGRAVSSMGADARDIDNDGREDLFVTANDGETFPRLPQSRQGPVRRYHHTPAEWAARPAHRPAGAPGYSTSTTTAERSVRRLRLDRRQRGGVLAPQLPASRTCCWRMSAPARFEDVSARAGARLPESRLEPRRRIRRSGWRWPRRRGGEPDRRARGDFAEYVGQRRTTIWPSGCAAHAAIATASARWCTSPAHPDAGSGTA